MDAAALQALIRDIPDFPKEGIIFKDVSPLLQEPKALAAAVVAMAEPFRSHGIDRVLGIESRGFLFAVPIAIELGAGMGLVRKPGKLPYDTHSVSYDLEYGSDAIEMQIDTVLPGQRVLVVDDLLATGGTAAAAVELVERAGGEVVGASFLIELSFLDGVSKLANAGDLHFVMRY
ncbi:MAG: adenine phosphoribosyltransferase [Myxococcota bacterium]|nr:adenine phosphoribosyltransferase [Myxococcota bacterium]